MYNFSVLKFTPHFTNVFSTYCDFLYTVCTVIQNKHHKEDIDKVSSLILDQYSIVLRDFAVKYCTSLSLKL